MNVFSLSWAAAGLALLGLSLFPAGSLALGGAPAHLAVFLLLLALAALALRLLRREGLDRPRLLDALLPIGLAFFLRALLLDYQSADYQMFLSQWAAAFRDGGGFAAVKLPIGNYNAPYLYFLAAISYLPIPDLYLIKLFSILFDVVLAWGGFRLVRHFAPQSPNRPLLCFCLLLLLPTVILNGAFWGQCDALYGALTLHALACALERRNRSSLLLLGIAFSFKLQTVFVLPLWGGLWLLRRVRFRELLWFPAAYAATCVPALLLGKPLGDILGVYLGQAAEYSGYLNLNAPNMYALIPHGAEVNTAPAARLGILAALLLPGRRAGSGLDLRVPPLRPLRPAGGAGLPGRLCGGPAGEIYPGGLPGWPPVPHAVRGPAHAGQPGLCGPLPRPPARLPSKIQRVTACPLPSGMPVQISCEISRKAVDELETMCYNLVTVFKNSYNPQRRSKWQLRIFP